MPKSCYSCRTELKPASKATAKELQEKKVQSKEHIFPNFLGGKLTSTKLLCECCNNELGRELEGAMAKELILAKLLDFNIHKGKQTNRGVEGVNEFGIQLTAHRDRQSRFTKPQVQVNDDGSIKSVVAKDIDQARGFLNAQKPKVSQDQIDEFLSKAKFTVNEIGAISTMKFEKSTIGSEEFYRGVVKIAVNFALINGINRESIQRAIDCVRTGKDWQRMVTFYYPLAFSKIHDLGDQEMSQIMYLRGNRRSKLLYCYIEFFNVSNLLIVLDEDYEGYDFEDQYCFDILTDTQIKKRFNLNITISPFDDLKWKYWWDHAKKNIVESHRERLDRAWEIINSAKPATGLVSI